MVMELADKNSLFHLLKKQKKLDEQTAAKYVYDVTQAIVYLHSMSPPILHRDIKPENILIGNDGKLKIADFGWSNMNLKDIERNTFCGTPDYLSPEMILGTGHSEKLDVWTLGVLLYELLHGFAPFSPKEKIMNMRLKQKMIEDNILKGKITLG